MNTTLLFYVIVPIALALIINIITYFTGWRMTDTESSRNKLLPPGYVVGIVWMILFGLLGYILYLTRGNPVVTTVVIIFLIYALSYNYLPRALFNLWNLIALLLAFMILFTILLTEKYAQTKFILLLMPLIAWATYVNVIFSI